MGQRCIIVYCKVFYSNLPFTQMEIARSRLCLTHFVSSKLWQERRQIYKPLPKLWDWNCPKSFREKCKRDPDQSEYICREHTCCSVNIHVLNSITNGFALKAQVGANFSVLLANHTTIYGMYTEIDLLTGQLKKRLTILIVDSGLLDNLPNLYN